VLSASLLAAQTKITAPKNKYTPAEDVKLGREAAAEARQQMPILRDERVTSFVDQIGNRLVEEIPAEFRHSEFRYTFDVVNVRDLNAFALPGGPMFINRGMIESARTEGEVAGVMAHELSHVILRHGTAQASKAGPYQLGQIAGAIAGAIVGGTVGSVIAQGTQFGLGTAFLRYGREYERQADILGAQIMARSGYDPRDMATMFKTIEKQSGSGGPEWLSDHPNPGNRSEYITREAQALGVVERAGSSASFDRARAALASMRRAPTAEQAARASKTSGRSRNTGRVEPPSSRLTAYTRDDLFRVSVPSNWRELSGPDAVTFAPAGGYGQINGRAVFTHGVQIGVERGEARDLRTATTELIAALARGNPGLGEPEAFRRATVDGRRALQTTLSNDPDDANVETIRILTTLVGDGSLLYLVAVAPADEFRDYEPAFQRVAGSLRILNPEL
jgi:predicted Zn-dependent protease